MKRHAITNRGDNEYPQILQLFYIENQQDLGKFISEHYKGHTSDIGKIPIKTWFLYTVEDRGDYDIGYIETVSDFKNKLYEEILSCSYLLIGLKTTEEL